ncbi:sulfite exporter TauE/SafE family protein [Nocardioides marinquilinus]|uniref:Probable membrane transporter protein n=1 Tax=Nocardioides marinquilinus TaxID=1210400 RepID=A0ABP9QA82_9ACTN
MTVVLALLVGFGVAALTAPVGVSGAVFLLPVQLSGFGVPNPRVTPTNLLYNVVSGPGALLRYRRQQQWDVALVRALLAGSLPGVAVGAVLRVFVLPGADAFRLVAAAVLVPTGLVLLRRRSPSARGPDDVRPWARRTSRVAPLAFVVGTVGGVYGIGGGSVLGPLLVGAGLSVRAVAPAALLSTFVTSVAGVVSFAVIGALASESAAATAGGPIAPDWGLGLALGLGGLVGGYVGARLQPRVPETLLRVGLGVLALAVGVGYVVQTAS